MSRVDLVFRTVNERTSDLALELAIKNIQPDNVFVIDNVRPFAKAVDEMLQIDHDCDQVVYVDADCLILEDMRPYLNTHNAPYVDCYVSDRFRGRIHCGVHITRIDVVQMMAQLNPPYDDHRYVLRPESRLRNKAMKRLGLSKRFRNFEILHDWFQWNEDIFAKYALRELRSRVPIQRKKLERALEAWKQEADPDFEVARLAIEYTAKAVPLDTPTEDVDAFIRALPDIAKTQCDALGISEKEPMTRADLDRVIEQGDAHRALGFGGDRHKVFGLGLSRTATRSLTAALQILGWDCAHYATDKQTLQDLAMGNYAFGILDHYDGMTDITVAPFYEELYDIYPDAKYILTVRDKESWLRSCRNHWFGRSAFAEPDGRKTETHLHIRRLLRAATYGCYDFNAERFSRVYDRHVAAVRAFFADKPDQFLEINITAGEGFEKLAPFLGVETPITPMPHKGNKLSKKIEEMGIFEAQLDPAAAHIA